MKTLTSIILAVVVVVGQLQVVAQERQWLSYEPATVELEGRLVIQNEYGPPNFGENPRTDQKLKVPVLVLTKAINVRGTPGAFHNAVTVRGAKRIQLIFTDPETDYKHLIGKQILVKGTLFHGFTGHHFTAVVMTVSSHESKK